jgi:hypothetical protein
MSTKPTRHGARWTKQEEDEILASIKAGLSLRIIATRKERSTSGIRARLTQIACRFVEVDKMPLYEAAERTGIKVDHLRAVLSLKMEPAPHTTVTPTPKMEFTFATTTPREELLAKPMKQKIARLQTIADGQAHAVNTSAYNGQSYLWEMDEPKLAQYLQQTNNHGGLAITLEEVMEALRARFPGCKVDRSEEWTDVPNRHSGQPPTRVLKSGIKIDWS